MSKGARTRAELIAIGLQVWREKGLEHVTATRCASLVGITHGGCLYHFKSTEAFRTAVAEQAVRAGDSVIVPQLIATGHAVIADMSPAVRQSYLAGL